MNTHKVTFDDFKKIVEVIKKKFACKDKFNALDVVMHNRKNNVPDLVTLAALEDLQEKGFIVPNFNKYNTKLFSEMVFTTTDA